MDYPFKDLRSEQVVKSELYWTQIDTHLESLQRVCQAKEFARATSPENAEIPVHLWNEPVEGFENSEECDKALVRFRWFGTLLFLKALWRDSACYLVDKYREHWCKQHRKRGKKLTPLETGTVIILKTTHSDWFEFQGGTRVVHLRFPLSYRKIARDGVPVFFEHPSPTIKEPQPPPRDPDMRTVVIRKLEKVMHRRYVLRLGIDIKSLIKYFSVPTGENDIHVVYDATANKLNEYVWVPPFWLPPLDSLL